MIRQLLAFGAATLLAAATGQTQILLNPNGTPYDPLVVAPHGHFIAALDLDAAGNLYYLDTDTAPTDPDGDRNTRLFRRTPGGVTTELFNFGLNGFASGPFGSFVRVRGNDIFWGENSTGTLWRATLGAGGGTLLAATKFAVVDGNFDLAFNSAGDGYLSANPGGFSPENRVFRLTLGGGSVAKINAVGDYSGPVVFDSAGHLLYGQAGFASSGGLFRFTASELETAGERSLDAAHLLLANGENRYLVFGLDGLLFQDAGQTLRQYDYDAGFDSLTLALSPDGFLGPLGFYDGDVYTIVSKGFGNSSESAIYRIAPEPGAAALLLLGAVACLGRRIRMR